METLQVPRPKYFDITVSDDKKPVMSQYRDQISLDCFAIENVFCPEISESEGPEITIEQMERDLQRMEKENPAFASVFRRLVEKKRAALKIKSNTSPV